MLSRALPTPPVSSAALRESAWHGQLQLLASLPHRLLTLAPAIATTLRSGLRADFATLGVCESDDLAPSAFWSERINAPLLEWLAGHMAELMATAPLSLQLATDGEAVRACFAAPDWSEHPVYRAAFAPLEARWAMGVPLLDRAGRCLGFAYVYRSAASGPFSDAEQAQLRGARDRLRGLEAARLRPGSDVRAQPTRSAVLRIDATGRIRARSADAYELLFIGMHQRVGSLAWAAPDLTALPTPVIERARRLLTDATGPAIDEVTLCDDDGGGMRYRLQRLVRDGAAEQPELVMTLCHLEPLDLAVARQLLRWPLSPRERQLVVACTRAESQREMAKALGCAVGTLKGYLNGVYAKLGVNSREAMIARLLHESTTSDVPAIAAVA